MIRSHVGTGHWMCVLSALATCSGCVAAGRASPAADAITRLLEQQAASWNAGDIDSFMEPYQQSPELSFCSGGQVTRGWSQTADRYRKRYPTRESMGRLTFDRLEVSELGYGFAWVLGRWNLQKGQPVGGVFTLILRREADRWVIVHDHTSRKDS